MVSSPALALTLLFASAVLATPVFRSTDQSLLKVELFATDENAVIEAAVTNTGTTDLSVLKLGSILDDSNAPIKKVSVFNADDEPVEFQGIFMNYDFSNLASDAFTTIKAGETVTASIELAPVFDLSSDSAFTVKASGLFQHTELINGVQARSTELSSMSFSIFEDVALQLEVDTTAAATVEKAIKPISSLQKRITLDQCTATENTTMTNTFALIVPRAAEAATAALSGPDSKMLEYFKLADSNTRALVAARFTAISANAQTANSGFVKYFCEDVFGFCLQNALSYTLSTDNDIINCPIYYTSIKEETTSCHSQDMWSVSIHEMTHAPGIYSPYTQDFTYGYAASTVLPANLSLNNADNFALFAHSVFLDC